MQTTLNPKLLCSSALFLALALGGCGKTKQTTPVDSAKVRAAAKRQQAACGSSVAYDRLKGLIFDQAIAARNGDRTNLDTLADYSFARMENPVVKGWDPERDVTQCEGHFILQLPPGAERAFGGAHALQADLGYSAQRSADGNGFVYQVAGAEDLAAKLATFKLTTVAYRPPPAIDDSSAQQMAPDASTSRVEVAEASSSANTREPAAPVSPPQVPVPTRQASRDFRDTSGPPEQPARQEYAQDRFGGSGEGTIRSFYAALGAGDGEAASKRIIPEKRGSRIYSSVAMSRFYGRLVEPIRLTDLEALPGGAYRVAYRYSAGRSRCNGRAIVRLTDRGGSLLIRSITALNGC